MNKRSSFVLRTIACLALLLYLSTSPLFALDLGPNLKISGYYKNLFLTSKTLATEEDYFADTNRLRLQFDAKLNDTWSANLTYDNDVILNDFSKTPDFDLIRQKNQKDLAFWDADHTITDKKHVYWKHSLYRAYIKYYSPEFQSVIGKQSIDWSRMRLYHPLDLFNPVSPVDIEKDEKIGVDAVNFELTPDSSASVNLICAPDKDMENAGFGLKVSKKVKDYDLSFIAANIKKDKIAGIGFDGYLWAAGLRGEFSYTRKDNEREFLRAIIGLDHNFTPKLYAVAEYFYNGGAEKDTAQFLNSFEFSRKAISMKKHIAGAGLEYELTGITKLSNYIFYDFEGKSLFYNPELRHNLRPNLDLSIGAQLFYGDNESEFGSYHHLLYAQAKYFF